MSGLTARMQNLLDALAHIVFPNTCMFCGRVIGYQGMLCETCERARPQIATETVWSLPDGLNGLAVPFWYEMGVEKAVCDLKFEGNFLNARKLAAYMAQQVRGQSWKDVPELIIPVPLTSRDRRRRGYNQAEQLGKWCARYLELPMETQALIKVRETKQQHQLDAASRRTNLKGAYRAKRELVSGKRVLLVDDVYTTGATMAECGRTLLAAGAAAVYGVSAAKTRPRGETEISPAGMSDTKRI